MNDLSDASSLLAKLQHSTIPDIQQAYRSGDMTITQVTDIFLKRIEKLNPVLNAVISVNPDAIKVAEEQDTLLRNDADLGPLFGIPLLIKDNIETRELPTTAGSLALADNMTNRDAVVISQLRTAGAIILAKTNLSEWAYFRSNKGLSGWSAMGGQTRNPHDQTRSPGGSSSGSGAGIAAGLAVAALGTETLGSVINPASANGVVGVKPTVGLVSQQGLVPISHTQDTAGPLTRCVLDAAILLGVMANADQSTDYGRLLKDASLVGKRFGVTSIPTGSNDEVHALFDELCSKMTQAGAEVVEDVGIELYDGVMGDFFSTSLYEFKHNINQYLAGLPNDLNTLTLASLIAFNEEHAEEEMPHFKQEIFELAEAKGPLSETEYQEAVTRKEKGTRHCIDQALQLHKLDAIIAPTQDPAWLINQEHNDKQAGEQILTGLAAIAGYPHITLPMGKVQGLPVGFSLVGRGFKEAELLQLAHAVQLLVRYDPIIEL